MADDRKSQRALGSFRRPRAQPRVGTSQEFLKAQTRGACPIELIHNHGVYFVDEPAAASQELGCRIAAHGRVMGREQQRRAHRLATADCGEVAVDVAIGWRERRPAIGVRHHVSKHGVRHRQRPASRIVDREVPEGVPGHVHDLKLPSITQVDGLAAGHGHVHRTLAGDRPRPGENLG